MFVETYKRIWLFQRSYKKCFDRSVRFFRKINVGDAVFVYRHPTYRQTKSDRVVSGPKRQLTSMSVSPFAVTLYGRGDHQKKRMRSRTSSVQTYALSNRQTTPPPQSPQLQTTDGEWNTGETDIIADPTPLVVNIAPPSPTLPRAKVAKVISHSEYYAKRLYTVNLEDQTAVVLR